jgi:hypothetical protein
MALHPNRPTAEGRALGAELARLVEPAIVKLGPDERCVSCAFRLGTIPNGCPGSVMDALKCALEGVTFLCHENGRKVGGERPVCHGYKAWRGDRDVHIKAPWPWSYEDGAA